MSNEIHIGIIEERKKEYPDRSDRSPEFAKWLELENQKIQALPIDLR